MTNQVFKDVTREVVTLTISNLKFFIQFSKLQLFFFCPHLRWPHISRLATALECIKECQYNFCHPHWSALIYNVCGIMRLARKHQTGHLGALHLNWMIILKGMLETFGFKMWIWCSWLKRESNGGFIQPSSYKGGYLNFSAWFTENILVEQKENKTTKYMAFCRKWNRDYAACLKRQWMSSLPIYICICELRCLRG